MHTRNIAATGLLILSGFLMVACGNGNGTVPATQGNAAGAFVIAKDPAITGYTQLAMNSKGEALVSWRQRNGSGDIIQAVTSSSTGSWGDTQAVSSRGSLEHRAAMSETGDAFVVWQDYPGAFYSIGSNHVSPGAVWDGVVSADTHTTGETVSPWVATSPTGTAFAVWLHFDTGTPEVWSNQRGVATGWGSPELLARVTGGMTYSPTVAVDNSGNAIAVWVEFQTTYAILAKWYQAGSGWDVSPTLIGAPEYTYAPKIGMDKDGNATVIWNYSGSDGHTGVQTNRYTPGSGWSGTETVIDLADSSIAWLGSPDIAVASDGTAVLAWEKNNGTKSDIWADRYVPGTGWTKTPVMLSDGTEESHYPRVAIDGKGNAVVAWRQMLDTTWSLWADSYRADTGWRTAQRLSAAGDKGKPGDINAAIDADGKALIVWDASYSDHSRTIWGYRMKQP